ncbi:MAG: hypothetical protein U0903_19110 [Planctomycetales bacterium]
MPEMINAACDICGQAYRRTVEELGKKAKCRVCGTTFEIVQKADPDELFDSEDEHDGNPLPWIKGGATSALILLIIFGLGSLLFIPAVRKHQIAQAEQRSTPERSTPELENPLFKRQEEMRTKMLEDRARRKAERARIAASTPAQDAPKVEEGVSTSTPDSQVAKVGEALVPKPDSASPVTAPAPAVASRRPVDRDLSGRYQLVETMPTMSESRLIRSRQRIPGQPIFPPHVIPAPGINSVTHGERSGEMSTQNSIEEKTTWRFKESFGPGGSPPKKP